MQHSAAGTPRLPLLLLALAVAPLLLLAPPGAHACGGHDDAAPLPWEKELLVKGRRRSLLSMKGRR